MSWVAVALGAGALLSGAGSYFGGKAQAGAADKATQAQLQMFGQTQQNLAPWLQGGKLALSELQPLAGITPQGFNPNAPLVKPFGLDDFQASPAYQFNLEQGQQAINKAAAARGPGNFYAPQTLQDISKFSQGLASNEFANAYNMYNQNQRNIWDRIYALQSGGQQAAANLGAFGTQVGGQVGENIIGAGNAKAAGTVGLANAIGGGIGDIANNYVLTKALQAQQSPIYGGYTGYGGIPGV